MQAGGTKSKTHHTYEFPRPAVTVDCVIFGLGAGDLKVLLIRRGLAPYRGRWALPGGFVRMDETLEQAARRELGEEAGVKKIFLEQLYTFGALKRDPRGRVLSVAYMALVDPAAHPPVADTDAAEARWFGLDDLPPLAFDHDEILALARERLRGQVAYRPVGFELLPRKFTLTQLQTLYETILQRPLDKRNFRRRILGMDFLEDTGTQTEGAHRPARLYRFNRTKYRRLEREGFALVV